jgi:hypothetical protein
MELKSSRPFVSGATGIGAGLSELKLRGVSATDIDSSIYNNPGAGSNPGLQPN